MSSPRNGGTNLSLKMAVRRKRWKLAKGPSPCQESRLLPGSPLLSVPPKLPLISQLFNFGERRNEEEGPTSDNAFPFGTTPRKLKELSESTLAKPPSFTNKELTDLGC